MISRQLAKLLVKKGVDKKEIELISQIVGLIKEGKYHEKKLEYIKKPNVGLLALDRPGTIKALGELGILTKRNKEAKKIMKLIQGDGWSFARSIPLEEIVKPEYRMVTVDTALNYVRKARSWYIRNYCPCREAYHNCDTPSEFACIGMNELADHSEEMGYGKIVDLETVEKRIVDAYKRGLLINQYYSWSFAVPEMRYGTVCLCCTCCCLPMQVWQKGSPEIRNQTIKKSDFISDIDYEVCTSCGKCIEKCVFKARKMIDGKVVVDRTKCYGCGRCTVYCTSKAISLELWRRY